MKCKQIVIHKKKLTNRKIEKKKKQLARDQADGQGPSEGGRTMKPCGDQSCQSGRGNTKDGAAQRLKRKQVTQECRAVASSWSVKE